MSWADLSGEIEEMFSDYSAADFYLQAFVYAERRDVRIIRDHDDREHGNEVRRTHYKKHRGVERVRRNAWARADAAKKRQAAGAVKRGYKCGACGGEGHNRRACIAPAFAVTPAVRIEA